MKKVCLAAAAAVTISAVLYQFSGVSSAVAEETRSARSEIPVHQIAYQAGENFEARFWNWLQDSKYKNWAPVPGKSGDAYPGKSPHGMFLKMYLNRTAAGNLGNLPHGSILVKENYGKDKKTLMAVTVMYRTKGYDSKHNDWYWVKYMPDGSVAKVPSMPKFPKKMWGKSIAGRFPSCIMCHGGADGKDFAFVNDK